MATQLIRDYLSGIDLSGAFPVGLLVVSSPKTNKVFIRLNSTQTMQISSRGYVYYPSGFDFVLPDKAAGDGETQTQLALPIPSKAIWEQLKAQPRLEYRLSLVLSSAPNSKIVGPLRLSESNRTYDTNTQSIVVSVVYGDVLSDPARRLRYSPSLAPGMFNKTIAPE